MSGRPRGGGNTAEFRARECQVAVGRTPGMVGGDSWVGSQVEGELLDLFQSLEVARAMMKKAKEALAEET